MKLRVLINLDGDDMAHGGDPETWEAIRRAMQTLATDPMPELMHSIMDSNGNTIGFARVVER